MQPLEQIPYAELSLRHALLREALQETCPSAQGILVFSRVSIYWLSGTLCNGLFWLPMEGDPVLMVRRSVPRAELESTIPHIFPYRSFSEISMLAEYAKSPLPQKVAVEMSGLSYDLGMSLNKRLSNIELLPGDQAIVRAKALKTPFEMERLREAGKAHRAAMYEEFPRNIHPGMNEREMSIILANICFNLGHCGILRTTQPANEVFICGVAAGENSNYPSHFNGPMGQSGSHPAAPVFGNIHKIWKPGETLMADMAFSITGYNTDKTVTYWGGTADSIPDEISRAHEFCIYLQNTAAARLKPGAVPSEIWHETLDMVRSAGYMDGFMGLGESKVPFLGHGIGLCIDEYPVIAERFDAPLKAGMVLALEPKISLPGVGMVGVENTYLVQEEGDPECITAYPDDDLGIVCVPTSD